MWCGEVAVCCTEDERRCDCKLLEQSLRMVAGAQRMVVGHTIQGAGINSACDNRVFRVDVGLSRGCGDGQPEVGTRACLQEQGRPRISAVASH